MHKAFHYSQILLLVFSIVLISGCNPATITKQITASEGGWFVGKRALLWIPPDALQEDETITFDEDAQGNVKLSPTLRFNDGVLLYLSRAQEAISKISLSPALSIPSSEYKNGRIALLYSSSTWGTGRPLTLCDGEVDCYVQQVDIPAYAECYDLGSGLFSQWMVEEGFYPAERLGDYRLEGVTEPFIQYPAELDSQITTKQVSPQRWKVTIPPHYPVVISYVFVISKQSLRTLTNCSQENADLIYSNVLEHEMGHVRMDREAHNILWAPEPIYLDTTDHLDVTYIKVAAYMKAWANFRDGVLYENQKAYEATAPDTMRGVDPQCVSCSNPCWGIGAKPFEMHYTEGPFGPVDVHYYWNGILVTPDMMQSNCTSGCSWRYISCEEYCTHQPEDSVCP